jgi:hypothetical protein
MICPKCGSPDIRASNSSRWSDIFRRIRGRKPLRCRNCRKRFFALGASLSDGERGVLAGAIHRPTKLMRARRNRRLVRWLMVISTFILAGLIFWFFRR